MPPAVAYVYSNIGAAQAGPGGTASAYVYQNIQPKQGSLPLEVDFNDGLPGPLVNASGGTWDVVDVGGGNYVLQATTIGANHRVIHTGEVYIAPPTSSEVPPVLTLSADIRLASLGTYLAGIHFGGSGGTSGYQALIDGRNGTSSTSALQIRRDAETVIKSSTAVTLSALEWYKLEVDWNAYTGDVIFRIYDSIGSLLDTLEVNDQTYLGQGPVGFYARQDGSQFDNLRVTGPEVPQPDNGRAVGGQLSAIGGTLRFITDHEPPPPPVLTDATIYTPPGGVSPARPGGWLWYTDRKAVYHHGTKRRTYFTFQDIGSEWNSVFISAYDHDTNVGYNYRLYPSGGVDDHNSGAIHVREDGRILVVYYNRSVRQLKARISTNPEDITSWGPQIDITSVSENQYPTLVHLASENRLYLIYVNGATSSRKLVYRTSNNGGNTWSSQVDLFDVPGGWEYPKITTDGVDKIHFLVTNNHPEVGPTSLFHFYYDAGVWRRSDGADMGSPSFTSGDATVVYDYSVSSVQGWNWDIALDEAGVPVVAYTTYPSTSDHRYNYAKWDGSAWNSYEIAPAGPSIDESGDDPYYSAGVALDPEDPSQIYISVPTDPGVWEIERWSTPDDGVTWTVEQALTSGSTVKNIRPLAVHGGGPIKVAWMAGSYASFTSWDTDMWVWPGIEMKPLESDPLPNIPDLLHHVDATSTFNTIDTDEVPIWADESPTGVDFTGSASPPIYRSGRWGEDLPALDFTGTRRYGSTGVTTTSGGFTEFIVVEPTAWSGNNPGFWRSASDSKGSTFHAFQGSSGRPWIRWGGTNVLMPNTGPVVELGLLQVIALRVTPGSSGGVTYRINGETQYSIDGAISDAPFSVFGFPFQNSVGETVSGYYGERIAYDRALSDIEIAAIESHLISKWHIGSEFGVPPLQHDFTYGMGPFTEQTGGLWSVVELEDGNFVLQGSTGSSHLSRLSEKKYGSAGEELWARAKVRVQGTGTLLPGLDLGGIQPVIDRRNGDDLNNQSFQIRSGGTNLGPGDGSPTIVTGEWYTIIARWLVGTEIEAWLYDSNGAQVGHLSASTQISPNGGRVGFVSYGNNNQFDDFLLSSETLLP